jgi:hypothetical protein
MSQLDLRQLQSTVFSLREELEKSAANTDREVQRERARSAEEIQQLKDAAQAIRDALEKEKHEADQTITEDANDNGK